MQFVQMSAFSWYRDSEQEQYDLHNRTTKQTFDKVVWACNLLAIRGDPKSPLVQSSARVSAESTMKK